MAKKALGRHRKFVPGKTASVDKFETAIAAGASIKDACFYAGMSKDVYYDYIRENPEYEERIDTLRNATKFNALLNVSSAISKTRDLNTSKWYLEKTDPNFTTKTQTLNVNASLEGEISSEQMKEIAMRILNGRSETPIATPVVVQEAIKQADGE